MKLTRFSLYHKPVIFVLMAILIILGYRSYVSLPREASPSITIPLVLVSTPYFGVSPGDIESLITRPIEKKIKEITEVKEIRSTSSEGFSSIRVEFNPDIDIDEAVQKVREKVDLARPDLPDDAEDPIINEINFSDFPIMLVNISGDYGLVRLKKIAKDLEDQFESVPGVLDVSIIGGLEREVKVNINLARLKYYNISFKKVIDAIRDENTNIPGGSIEMGKLKYSVRVPGEFSTPEAINNIIVKVINGKPIYIKDLAKVEYGFKDRTSYARQNGLECITLSVTKRSGENIIQVSDGVKAKIQEALPTLPPGTRIDILADQSKIIHRMVNELENNIISGLILVVGVLFLFLGFRNSLFVAISIPLSMLISFVVIQALGYTLNMVVLFSLILALGMLVDNAIVIIENIYRHREEGAPLLEAAYKGTKEVGAAIIASTITTLCAFAPMIFWPGIMGEFMSYLPITLIIT
ncbi:MAG: efflux RND transporter permease subunit, partial [Calditrichaeota bacterium]